MPIVARSSIKGLTIRKTPSGVSTPGVSPSARQQLKAPTPGVMVPWLYDGLLWPMHNGVIPEGAMPIGATSYIYLQSFFAASLVPPSAYGTAPCSWTDLPISYFDNGSGAGGIAIVYTTRIMAFFARTLLGTVFEKAGLDIRHPPPLTTTTVLPSSMAQIQVNSPRGPSQVPLTYLLMTPKPVPSDDLSYWWDGSYFFGE